MKDVINTINKKHTESWLEVIKRINFKESGAIQCQDVSVWRIFEVKNKHSKLQTTKICISMSLNITHRSTDT